nr:unnamed protein product [Callosobruchus analis]
MSISFFTGVLLFCTTLFKIVEMEVNFSELIFLLPYALGVFFILLMHCWYGNEIIYKSAGISTAIFNSKWIGAKIPMQKTVILFMLFTKILWEYAWVVDYLPWRFLSSYR